MNISVLPEEAFIEEIQEVLSSTSRSQLRQNLLSYAAELSLERRLEFLQLISFSKEDVAEDEDLNAALAEDPSLEEDSLRFLDNIRNRVYDHSLDIEQTDEVPQWVDHMDVLFSRADEVFFHDRKPLARKIYETLFEALHIAEDIALDHGSHSAQEVVVTDLYEVKARFLRSVYDTEPLKSKSTALLKAIQENVTISQMNCGLAEIQEADYEDLEEFEEFLPLWKKALMKKTKREGFEDTRLWLLREQAFLANGVEGLHELADSQGEAHPEVFYDLVNIYVKSLELKKAESVCSQGIEALKQPHHQAVLADWLAEIAARDGDTILALQYRKKAWRLEPTQRRLVKWCVTNHGVLPDDQLIEEVEYLRSFKDNCHVRLICMLELLAGEYNLPRQALLAASPLGWTVETHPGAIVLPYLLLAAADLKEIPLKSSLHDISEEMKSAFVRWQDHFSEDHDSPRPQSFLDYALPALEKHVLGKEQKRAFLDTVRVVILDRVKAVSEKGMIHVYRKVAHLVTAYVEACLIFDDVDAANNLLNVLHSRHFRNTGLRSEVRHLLEASEVTRNSSELSRV